MPLPHPGANITVASGVLLRSAAAFAFTKACATLLGPAEFGRYGHYLMLAQYLLTISSSGMSNALTVYLGRRLRDGAVSSEDIRRDTSSAVLAGGVMGGLAGVILAAVVALGAAGALLPPIPLDRMPWWLLFCVGSGMSGGFLASLLAAERHRAYQVLSVSMPTTSVAVLAAMAWVEKLNPERAIYSYMVGFLVPGLVYAWRGSSVRLVTRRSLVSVARFSLIYLLPSLLIPTIGSLTTLAVRQNVAENTSPVELGQWQGLWRLAESYMGVLAGVVSALFIPRFAKSANRHELSKHLRQACLTAYGLYLPVALMLLVLPQQALSLLLARSFTDIARMLPLQVVGDLLKIAVVIVTLSFTALMRPGLTLFAELGFCAGFFGIARLLTPDHGAAGAVGAYAAAYVCLVPVLIPFIRGLIRNLPDRRQAPGDLSAS